MKTAISLPDTLFEAADRLARRLGISRSELVQRALLALVSEHDDASVTEALDVVYGKEDRPARLAPGLTRIQAASLDPESW
jgi:metal-responsive CopG/Arc/MetJ family transcriptional regulator